MKLNGKTFDTKKTEVPVYSILITVLNSWTRWTNLRRAVEHNRQSVCCVIPKKKKTGGEINTSTCSSTSKATHGTQLVYLVTTSFKESRWSGQYDHQVTVKLVVQAHKLRTMCCFWSELTSPHCVIEHCFPGGPVEGRPLCSQLLTRSFGPLYIYMHQCTTDRFQVVGGNWVFYSPPMPISNWLCA